MNDIGQNLNEVPLEILLSVGRFDPAQFNRSPGPSADRSPSLQGRRGQNERISGSPRPNAGEGLGVRGEHRACHDPDCDHHHHLQDHNHSFSTWSFESDRPLSLEALRTAASKLPASFYRAKGVVYTSDAPERRAVLQVVGKRVVIYRCMMNGATGFRARRL